MSKHFWVGVALLFCSTFLFWLANYPGFDKTTGYAAAVIFMALGGYLLWFSGTSRLRRIKWTDIPLGTYHVVYRYSYPNTSVGEILLLEPSGNSRGQEDVMYVHTDGKLPDWFTVMRTEKGVKVFPKWIGSGEGYIPKPIEPLHGAATAS